MYINIYSFSFTDRDYFDKIGELDLLYLCI